jgi:hypothetical protein
LQGHDGDAFLDDGLDVVEVSRHRFDRTLIDERIVILRVNALAEHHLEPALRREQLVRLADDAAVAAEEVELCRIGWSVMQLSP